MNFPVSNILRIFLLSLLILLPAFAASAKNKAQLQKQLKACARGKVVACNNAGKIYARGEGVRQDIQKALSLFIRACENGYKDGCNNAIAAARQIRNNLTPEQVDADRKACDKGELAICVRLAKLYQDGSSVKQNGKEALRLYMKACDGGNADGCHNAGYLHSYNIPGVKQDHALAMKLYIRACDGGAMPGCGLAGLMPKGNAALDTQRTKAIARYEKACKGGKAESCKQAKLLQGQF